LRVIGGTARGRRLLAPKNRLIRPTSDRVKESLFNIVSVLLGSFEGCCVLDIFAGSGALGVESLSRGAASAVFIDRDKEAAALIRKNLKMCGFSDRARVLERDALPALTLLGRSEPPFRLVFIDPPYGLGLAEKVLGYLAGSPLIDENTVVVAEISSKEPLPAAYGPLSLFDRRVYGDTAIAFFRS
jgi:16S rRNA (guanine(966)-N(2))-methyltransferase RsmD